MKETSEDMSKKFDDEKDRNKELNQDVHILKKQD